MIHAEIARLMPEGSLQAPPSPRTPEFAGGEWDWYYQLSPGAKRKVLRHCQPVGLGPDSCASAAGFEYVDDWAVALLAAVDAPRDTGREPAPYAQMLDASELVGPVEVAEMLGVAVNTVHVWRKRQLLPAVWAVISGTALWSRWEILEWADTTGRIACTGPEF